MSPSALAAALGRAPNLGLVHASGPLSLYRISGAPIPTVESAPYFATINTSTPDLQVLTSLPYGAALAFHKPMRGIPSLQEVPPTSDWDVLGNRLTWAFVAQPMWTYELLRFGSQTVPQPKAGSSELAVNQVQGEKGSSSVEVTIDAKDDLINGSFRDGPWGTSRELCQRIGRQYSAGSQRNRSAAGRANGWSVFAFVCSS